MATTDAVAIPVAPSAVGARRMVELFTWDSIARRRLVDYAAAVQEQAGWSTHSRASRS